MIKISELKKQIKLLEAEILANIEYEILVVPCKRSDFGSQEEMDAYVEKQRNEYLKSPKHDPKKRVSVCHFGLNRLEDTVSQPVNQFSDDQNKDDKDSDQDEDNKDLDQHEDGKDQDLYEGDEDLDQHEDNEDPINYIEFA